MAPISRSNYPRVSESARGTGTDPKIDPKGPLDIHYSLSHSAESSGSATNAALVVLPPLSTADTFRDLPRMPKTMDSNKPFAVGKFTFL